VKVWLRALWRSGLIGLGSGIFLAAVGAFGSDRMAPLPRFALFLGMSVLSILIAASGVTAATLMVRASARPAIRYVVAACLITPMVAVASWLVVGFAVTGGIELRFLPYFLPTALLITIVMSLLSWAIFRPRSPAADRASPPPPRFLERLPVRLRGAEIYAVEAEDHYLRLHTSKGQDLILMRLSDAIAELEGIEGAQTHRSWWVAKSALADARRGDGRAVLKLKDGSEAPVSRTYAKGLREAGWY
jgi:hypothetical protein